MKKLLAMLLAGALLGIFLPKAERSVPERSNPKRTRREAARAVERRGLGTKAQQALSAQREQEGEARRARSRCSGRRRRRDSSAAFRACASRSPCSGRAAGRTPQDT